MKIVIAAGSSGGHLFPGIGLAQELRTRGVCTGIVIVIGEQAASFLHEIAEDAVLSLRHFPAVKRTWHIIVFLRQLANALACAFSLMHDVKPDVVVVFGSYISLPLAIAAWCCNVRLVVHEQNIVVGLSNRLTGFFADTIALSFPPRRMCSIGRRRVIYTGNIIRPSILNRAKTFTYRAQCSPDEKHTIAIIGGSQGAHTLNCVALDMLASLNAQQKKTVRVYHLLGEKDFHGFAERYGNFDIEYYPFAFFTDMASLYEKAALVISRAGSGTMFELMAFGIPAIFIPYPFAKQHQSKNAAYLEEHKAALVVEQDVATGALLKDMVFSLLNDPEKRSEMSAKMRSLFVSDAAAHMADEVLQRGQERVSH